MFKYVQKYHIQESVKVIISTVVGVNNRGMQDWIGYLICYGIRRSYRTEQGTKNEFTSESAVE
jgi:hypothetical protein